MVEYAAKPFTAIEPATHTGKRTLHLSWQTVHDGLDALAYSLEKLQPRTIVGVARGGLIPATILSHKLNCRLDVIKASAYDGTRRTLHRPIVIEGWKDAFNTDGTVIVDDILDSGDTFEAIKMKAAGFNVMNCKFAALFTKRTIDGVYFGRVSPDVWVKFPWEGDET